MKGEWVLGNDWFGTSDHLDDGIVQHKLDSLGACNTTGTAWNVLNSDSEGTDAIVAEIFGQHVCAVTVEFVSELIESLIMRVTISGADCWALSLGALPLGVLALASVTVLLDLGTTWV